MKKSNPPVLRHIAALWSLLDYPNAKKPWSIARPLEDVKAAGFDGIATFPTEEHRKVAEKLGLIICGGLQKSHRPIAAHDLGFLPCLGCQTPCSALVGALVS